MIKVGHLYDSISNNTGDIAIGLSLKNFCDENGFAYEVVDPFNVDPSKYSTLIIGGGHIIREKGDSFYDNFRVHGSHVLMSAGLTTDKDLDYLNDYKFVSVRSEREAEMLRKTVSNGQTVPCTTLSFEKKTTKTRKHKKRVGIHLVASTLTACPDIERAITTISSDYEKNYIPFTHYNKDRSLMESSGLVHKEDNLIEELNTTELFELIGEMDFLITSSLHATIFAYIQGVPFISFYQQKIYDFLIGRGLEERCFKNTDELIALLDLVHKGKLDFDKTKIEHDKETVKRALDKIKDIIIEDGKNFESKKGVKSLKNTNSTIQAKDLKIGQLNNVIKARDQLFSVNNIHKQQVIEQERENVATKQELIERKQSEIHTLNQQLEAMLNSRKWKVAAFLGKAYGFVLHRTPHFIKRPTKKFLRITKRVVEKTPFLTKANNNTAVYLQQEKVRTERSVEYKKWFANNYPNKTELKAQKVNSKNFKKIPQVSLIMPTYNTNTDHLRKCIDSVMAQTYSNWQLCIADDASTDASVRRVLREYEKKDERINVVFRKNNGHICRASNSALKIANGEYVSLLDHDDFLWPNALYEIVDLINKKPHADLIYTDEDKIEEDSNEHTDPFFKPSWSPDYLRSVNYITHFTTIRRQLIEELGGFRPGYEGAQDWDLFLRVSRKTDSIHHIPKILYSWRKSESSTAQTASAKGYAYKNQKKALADDVKQRGYSADVGWEIPLLMWDVQYKLKKTPLISVVIPTKNGFDYINTCLKSIKNKTTYANLEIIIVDTGSTEQKVWRLYKRFNKSFSRVEVLEWSGKFNFSKACNDGAKIAKGEYLIFLNNDTEIIEPRWVERLLEQAQQPTTGAVGCKLLYPDKKLQHAGVILGVGGNEELPGIAGHFFPHFSQDPYEDPAQPLYIGGVRNFSAVTAACLMVKTEKFNQVRGFDPKFQIAFNDVDFCLRLRQKGYYNVYTPHVELYHHESISVGKPGSKQRNINTLKKEADLMYKRWGRELIENDPYYHPDFRRDIASARLGVE